MSSSSGSYHGDQAAEYESGNRWDVHGALLQEPETNGRQRRLCTSDAHAMDYIVDIGTRNDIMGCQQTSAEKHT